MNITMSLHWHIAFTYVISFEIVLSLRRVWITLQVGACSSERLSDLIISSRYRIRSHTSLSISSHRLPGATQELLSLTWYDSRHIMASCSYLEVTDLVHLAGIDYRVKMVCVGDSQVALQLWDTAGQERWEAIPDVTLPPPFPSEAEGLGFKGQLCSTDLWPFDGRYRCITQQFFRKADGVIVMYDLTAKQSFLSVRQWLSSVEVSWWPS